MLKIGLTQRVEVLADRGERRDCLDQAWTRLLIGRGYHPIPLPNCVEDVDELVAELGLDGVILTGGNDLADVPGATNPAPERDAFERKLLECCAGLEIPALGVCRGLQMIVVHYGGRVCPVRGHVATRHGITGCEAFADRVEVNSYHDFGICEDDLPADLRPMARAPDGSVEAVAHQDLPQWGIMWHPERAPQDQQDLVLISRLFDRRRTCEQSSWLPAKA